MGVLFIVHGRPKLFGKGKNEGLTAFAGWLKSTGFPVPQILALVVAILEVFGGIALIIGFAVPWVALLFAIEFLVIILKVKARKPFTGDPMAWEYDLILLAGALTLLLTGAGPFSVDSWYQLRW